MRVWPETRVLEFLLALVLVLATPWKIEGEDEDEDENDNDLIPAVSGQTLMRRL